MCIIIMILLNIITRCTRTTKIKEVFESIDKKNKNFKINWYVLFDLTSMSDIPTDVISFIKDKSEIRFYDSDPDDFGHDMINKTIDEIQDGFVYVLDDDNIIHPNFLGIIQDWIENHNQYDGIIFSQKIQSTVSFIQDF